MNETVEAKEPAASKKNIDQEVSSRLLEIVRELAAELNPHNKQTLKVTLDSDLDRDLGLDSLGRAELLTRLARAFAVSLSEQLLVDANTPGALLEAVRKAGPALPDSVKQEVIGKPELPSIEAPSSVGTLVDVLQFHAREHPHRPHLHLLEGDEIEAELTYWDLHHKALCVAYGLVSRGLQPSDRVAIMLPTEAAFFEAFFGVLYAGGVPVPMYPPFRRSQVEDHLRRQAGILQNAKIGIMIVSKELRKIAALLFGLADSLQHVETVPVLAEDGPINAPVENQPNDVALIQYTSGSTGDPKGVVLTHANLLANIRAMGEALEATSDDVFVSWLPLYHDMGLIGAWLGSLYFGPLVIIMSPLSFLADPLRWLRTLSKYRGTLSAAPNFAFELCCKNLQEKDLKGLDLSSVRMILNGAEPVSVVTIDRFTEAFAPCGFRPEMMWPVYGMAENSVGLAFPPIGRQPLIDHVERKALSQDGVAKLARSDDSTALTFVACGRPIPRHQIRIVDDTGYEVPERYEGRLQFKGPSSTSGYFSNPEKNKTLFAGNWLESGDRAYMANGDVFITGRIKDMIIKAGRNIYPHEIEELVGQVEGVRKGCIAAVASTDHQTGTERIVLVVETRITDNKEKEQLSKRIVEACADALNLTPDVVELVVPHTVPKTSSGKIRRAATAELYESGFITGPNRGLWLQLVRLAVSGWASRIRRFSKQLTDVLFAGYWWMVLIIIALIAWPMVLVLPKRSLRHRILHQSTRLFLKLVGATPQVQMDHPIPENNVLIVANHSSYLDPMVILSVLPGQFAFVAKGTLAGQWVAGPFLKRLGTIFVDRALAKKGIEDAAQALEAAKSGERVVTFPEGTITRISGLLSFRMGAFVTATQAGLPIVPVTLRGTRSILRSDQWFPRRGELEVHIGAPIYPEGSDFAAAVVLRDKVRAVILAQCGEPDYSHERIEMPEARLQ